MEGNSTKLVSLPNLNIILKTVERCNINCKYCYFFNGVDKSFKQHPPYISSEILKSFAHFLNETVNQYPFSYIKITVHGGEPLMQKKGNFDEMCDLLSKAVQPYVKLVFNIQTNGILIDKDWLELLLKYQFNIGVSIDGPIEYHDLYRVDHQNRGTYLRVVEAIHKIQQHSEYNLKLKLGALSVINPHFNPRKIYRHFVDDLKLTHFDLLLPDFTNESPPPDGIEKYANFLCDLFEEWVKDDNPRIHIRILATALKKFIELSSGFNEGEQTSQTTYPVLTIASNGDIAPIDDLRSANPRWMQTGLNVQQNSFHDVLHHPSFQLQKEEWNLPNDCQTCCWQEVCRGGALIHRYNRTNGFNNKSVYCEALKELYRKISKYLLKQGFTYQQIERICA